MIKFNLDRLFALVTRKKPRAVVPVLLGPNEHQMPYLALAMISSYLRKKQGEGMLSQYIIGRLFPAGLRGGSEAFVLKYFEKRPDAIAMFSSYVWNHQNNVEIAAALKRRYPKITIVFGGPHVPKYEGETEAFLKENPFIDIAVLGEGEVAMYEVLEALSGGTREQLAQLSEVTGIVFRSGEEFVRTPERKRVKDINELPSPYLGGELGEWFNDFASSVLETNRGCPYGCVYCDWGSATLAKVSKFTPERVAAEVEFIAKRRAKNIFIADANFGMLEQDIEIAEKIVEINKKYGYPQSIATNFAKNGGRRLMRVIEILHSGGLLPVGIISLQSTDPKVLKAIDRDNIKTKSYETMMRFFNERNIPMSSDMMIGLPGQTIDSFQRDLQFCFDWKVTANAHFTSMMPNAPMAAKEYRERFRLVTDEEDMIISSESFSSHDMDYMRELFTTYNFFVKCSVLKCILYFMQLEHDVLAIEFLRRWLDCIRQASQSLPISRRIYNEIFKSKYHREWGVILWQENADFLFHDLASYYHEIFDFATREFGIKLTDTEKQTLIDVQQSILPMAGRHYPYQTKLGHI